MKLHLAFIALLFPLIGFAQGSLQFNQVKLVTTIETVPAGKVWKVESVIYNIPVDITGYQTGNSANCNSTSYRSTAIEINGTPTKTGQGMATASYSNLAYTHAYTRLPLWLPAGATLSGGICNLQISVIEFNIIP
jgi:hypothetical protein